MIPGSGHMAPPEDPQRHQSSPNHVNATYSNESTRRRFRATVDTMLQQGSAQKRRYGDMDIPSESKHEDVDIDEAGSQLLAELHDGKRSRNIDWPNSSSSVTGQVSSDTTKIAKKSPSPPRRRLRSKWSSRFLEGSMNDRPSKQPPSSFIGDEKLVDKYMAEDNDKELGTSEDMNALYDAGIQSTRPSSMYRFGKAIVNAFNPVWHGIHEMWKDKPDERVNAEMTALEGRRVKAEKAYADLKKEGYPGTQGVPAMHTPVFRQEDGASRFSRDSGIDVDGYRSSTERKRDGIVFDVDDAPKAPSSAVATSRSATPGSEANSRSSLRLHKPSFPSLKNVKSHLQLSSSKRQSASLAPLTPIEKDAPNDLSEQNVVKKQVSKKDLHKQQRLNKRVSDLESQLEKARRELQESMAQAPPMPPLPAMTALRSFVPGALASLPSERLLNQNHVPPPNVAFDSSTTEIENALKFPEEDIDIVGPASGYSITPTPKTGQSKGASPKKPVMTKKRKSGDAEDLVYIPGSSDEEDHGLEKKSRASAKMKRGRPFKAQKTGSNASPGSTNVTHKENIPETPNESSPTNYNVSDLSATSHSTFDPAKVDKAKILSMRSNPNSAVPFGRLSDDIVNLRKEFPGITNDQVVKFIALLLNGDKQHPPRRSSMQIQHSAVPKPANDVHSLLQSENARPSVLLRSRSMSPVKKAPRARRSMSPPPSLEYSKRVERVLVSPTGDREDDVITVSPIKDKDVPPVPRVPRELEGEVAEVLVEEEGKVPDWEWDDDVF